MGMKKKNMSTPHGQGRKAETRRSGNRVNAFTEDIHDGIYETDFQGNFTYFNHALSRILGYPGEEIKGRNFSHFMDRGNARKAYDAFSRVWVTHKGFSDIIWRVQDKTGHTRVMELSANLIRDGQGKKLGFRGVARDVTDRYKAQEALRASEVRYQQAYERSRRAERRAKILLDFAPYPMVVYTLDSKVSYINPAFTETFGWRLEEVKGKWIPYVPEALEEEARKGLKRLTEGKRVRELRSKRLTKDGRTVDVHMRGAVFSVDGDVPGGELVIFRDITEETRLARNTEALLRISVALPAYPNLEGRLDYISDEVKRLLNVDAVQVMLLDEERKEFYFKGAAYDQATARERVKEIRFPADKGLAGKVVQTGEPILVPDISKESDFYPIRDERLGFRTRNLLDVPLRSADRIIGVLSALNKREGVFGQSDVELLSTIAGTVALSIENARFSDELKAAYKEVTGLNRAKDRVINHLSHELKTPLAVLSANMNILERRMPQESDKRWKSTLERSQRNIKRLIEIQEQAEDIMRGRDYRSYRLLTHLLAQCSDELEALVARETGEGSVVERIREQIETLFRPGEGRVSEIHPDRFVRDRLDRLKKSASHRRIAWITHLEEVPGLWLPVDVAAKVVDGLIRNAVENSPDGGRIEVRVQGAHGGTVFSVRDFGIGITEENQQRIFEGFFPTQETLAYSTKRPFDFNAGGKGADLLRMKIFAERYGFKIEAESSRCTFIPRDEDVCPGDIAACDFCEHEDTCFQSGGSTFKVSFPPALQEKPVSQSA